MPQPLRPLGLTGHFGQYGQIVVALARRARQRSHENHDSERVDGDAADQSVFALSIAATPKLSWNDDLANY